MHLSALRIVPALLVAASLALLPPVAAASPFALPALSTAQGEVEGEDEDEAPDGEEAPAEDPTVAEAKAEYKAGSDAYALGNYEAAVGHFERAYELSGEPALLFNLGQAYTRWYDIDNDVEHLKKARRLYENYDLNLDATNLDDQSRAEARADAQHRIREVDRRIADHERNFPSNSQEEDTGEKKPLAKKAWFWIAVLGGAAVAGGVATAVILTTRPAPLEPELGIIGNNSGGLGLGPGGLSLRF